MDGAKDKLPRGMKLADVVELRGLSVELRVSFNIRYSHFSAKWIFSMLNKMNGSI
jgi:hypothetical protein